MYEYTAWLLPNKRNPTGVVDGDTMNVGVDLGFDVAINTALRIYGINAPEMKTIEGKAAKEWAIGWFVLHCPGSKFLLRTQKDATEKYGRYLATIIAPDGAVYNADIVEALMAEPYFP